MIEINRANKYIEAALNSRALRQDLISSNIANVDTPYYRAKDIDFETMLAKHAHQEFEGTPKTRLQMAKTDSMHIDPERDGVDVDPTIFYRDGHMARNDGNTVDLDVETTELSKNTVMYNALVETMRKNKAIYNYALESGKQL